MWGGVGNVDLGLQAGHAVCQGKIVASPSRKTV